MGNDLYNEFPAARETYQKANQILGWDVAKISFVGPELELKQTKITQPAIFVHSVIVTDLLRQKGCLPSSTAGHSLGEFSAHVCAGALDFEVALRIVKLRAELMQKAGEEKPGTMAAVIGMEPAQVEQTCREASVAGIVQPANFNSPGQIVISGSREGVTKAMEIAKTKGAKIVKELVVSGAFHSPLMESAKIGLKKALEDAPFHDAKIPIYVNVTGQSVQKASEIRKYAFEQLTNPVRWQETVENMITAGMEVFYELGPGDVLKGLVKRINKSITCTAVGDTKSLHSVQG
jgi:[acyl-carrier-protein] S-malonyltransferase